MTSDPHALELPDDEQPTDDMWTPGHVTESTSVPDRHDITEARADK